MNFLFPQPGPCSNLGPRGSKKEHEGTKQIPTFGGQHISIPKSVHPRRVPGGPTVLQLGLELRQVPLVHPGPAPQGRELRLELPHLPGRLVLPQGCALGDPPTRVRDGTAGGTGYGWGSGAGVKDEGIKEQPKRQS